MKDSIDEYLEEAHQKLINNPRGLYVLRLKIRALEEEYHLKTIQDEIRQFAIRDVPRKS